MDKVTFAIVTSIPSRSKPEFVTYDLSDKKAEVSFLNSVKAAGKETHLIIDLTDMKVEHKAQLSQLLKSLSSLASHEAKLCSISVISRSGDYSADLIRELHELCSERNITFSLPPLHENKIRPHEYLLPQRFSLVGILVDEMSFPESEFLASSKTFVPPQLARDVHQRKLVNESFWYWDEKGASIWLSVKEAKRYQYFKNTYDVLSKNISEIWTQVIGRSLDPVDVLALGVGSCEKELLLLWELCEYLRIGSIEFGAPINYIPVDISFPLLENSIRMFYSDSKLKGYRHEIRIRPILCDFLSIDPSFFDNTNSKKLITSLGTLVNVPERAALECWKKVMNKDSFLLVDVEFIGSRTDDDLKKEYEFEEAYNLWYHPIDVLVKSGNTKQMFRVGGQEIPYSYFQRYRRELCNIVLQVIQGDNIETLKQDDVPTEALRGFHFSDVIQSKTVVCILKRKPPKSDSVVLGYSTKYEYEGVKTFISNAGFEIKKEYLSGDGSFGYFLLKLAG